MNEIPNINIDNEFNFNSLFGISPVGFALNRYETGEFLQGNQALFDLVGYSFEEFRNLSYWDITPKKFAKDEEFALKQLSERGAYGPYQKEYIHKDGSLIPVLLKGTLIERPNGEKFIFSIVQDISEQNRQLVAISALGKIIEDSKNEIYIIDSKTLNFYYVNQSARYNLGYSEAEFEQLSLLDIKFQITEPEFRQVIQPLVDNSTSNINFQTTHQRKDGSIYHVDVYIHKTVYLGHDCYAAIVLDIDERVEAGKKLRQLSQAVEQSLNSIFITDPNGVIEYANRKFYSFHGFTADEVLGQNPKIIKSGVMPDLYYKQLWLSLKNGESWHNEVCNKRKDGTFYWANLNISAVKDSKGKIINYLCISEDITKKREQEQKIIHQANYDSLTGVYNRFSGIQHLKQKLKESDTNSTKTVVIFLDIDNFKNINDYLGHTIGDLVLGEVCKRLEAAIREDDILIRFGGDEFLIILTNLKALDDANLILNTIYEQFNKPYTIENHEIFLTISTGISVSPRDSNDAEELIQFADSAMYHSKNRGKNTFHYYNSQISDSVKNNFTIEKELRLALKRKEFTVVFQPFIDLQNSAIIGAEALLRWKNKKLGQVSPDDFIPIAEQTGMIESIGEYVLDQSLAFTMAHESKLHPDFQISVNISPRQFRGRLIITHLKSLMDKYQISPNRIKLEVTEGLLVQSHDDPIGVLNELKSLGISVAMDDFGTGYSSLKNLRQFKFNLLKIDRSFIFDLMENSEAQAMVDAIIAMCHSMKLKVIAEGIETKAQMDYLLAKGCDFGQGYYFHKPLTRKDFIKIVSSKSG